MNKSSLQWGPAPRRQIDVPNTLADEAYQLIHNDIIRGEFAPNDKLQPDALRERYKIGLSPVREALSRIALEGLAVTEGQRGFFVAPATREELLDIADLRINFSVLSLERSIRRGGDDWENAVVTTYYQLNKLENQSKREPKTFHDEWERRNRDFHQALESGCGSPWLLHFCDILYDQLERYRRRFVVYTDIDPTIAEEHRQIMELALARDTAACKVLKQHFEHAARVIGGMMEKAESTKPASTPAVAPKAKVAAQSKGKPAVKRGKPRATG
jgi:GntR family transcriptional regulator, carbon starvation induced regulator